MIVLLGDIVAFVRARILCSPIIFFFNFPFVYSSCLYMFIYNADSAGEHLIMSIFNYLDDWMCNKLEALEMSSNTQKIKEQCEYILETNYKHVTLTDVICPFN